MIQSFLFGNVEAFLPMTTASSTSPVHLVEFKGLTKASDAPQRSSPRNNRLSAPIPSL